MEDPLEQRNVLGARGEDDGREVEDGQDAPGGELCPLPKPAPSTMAVLIQSGEGRSSIGAFTWRHGSRFQERSSLPGPTTLPVSPLA